MRKILHFLLQKVIDYNGNGKHNHYCPRGDKGCNGDDINDALALATGSKIKKTKTLK